MPYRGTLAEKVLLRAKEIAKYVLEHDCHAVTEYAIRRGLGYSHSMSYHALRKMVELGLAKKCLDANANVYWVCPQLCRGNVIEHHVNINLNKFYEFLYFHLESTYGEKIRLTSHYLTKHFLLMGQNDPYISSLLMSILQRLFEKTGAKYELKIRTGYYGGLTFHTTRDRLAYVLKQYKNGITIADIC